ncbi:HAD-IIB family hydrolase [Hydrogenovibrio kuenenii]|uniref:HAD-IIB family hydrolase n=1 Tax=Hydrogenovibrio kuenenii TaxID=63658 RepID=UPI000465D153|nr:HAD-IIB family hydrolase [Hydrogenovibrio kuenenii]
MNQQSILLCTDMDRTLIPNGEQPDEPESRRLFAQCCRLDDVSLIYVTGRHKALVEEAIAEYNLPTPDYAITDVGTQIYHVDNGKWQVWQVWEDEIAPDWQGWTNQSIRKLLAPIEQLLPQEESKQNHHKLSYYVSLPVDEKILMKQVEASLAENAIKANLIWSIDDLTNVGLLDILPASATKLHAIRFLHQRLNHGENQVFFAGDSGNDLPVLASEIPSVLVANATDSVRKEAQLQARKLGNERALYLAKKQQQGNGNYVDGILQGLEYFKFCNLRLKSGD